MKKSSQLALATLLISPTLLANVYFLEKNETVSELLYNRLKISPIYRGGYLKKVLDYNKLDLETSKTLPKGTAITLPVDDQPSQIAEATEPSEVVDAPEVAVEEPVVVQDQGKNSFYLGANAIVESMNGNIEPTSYSTVFLYPQLRLGAFRETENYLQQLEGSLSYITFEKDKYMVGDNQLLNLGLTYQLLRKQNQFRYGLKVAGENTTLVISTSDDAGYRLKNPFFLSVGPSIQWQGLKSLSEVVFLYTPSQKIDSDNKMSQGLSLQLSSYRPFTERLSLGVMGGYTQHEVENVALHKFYLGIGARLGL